MCSKHDIGITVHALQIGDDLESVTLINQELLALGRVIHFLCIARHQRVEEGVEALIVTSLGSQNTAQTLSLLTSGTVMRGNLNQTSSFWQIDTGIANLGQENGTDCRIVLEVLQNTHTFLLTRATINVRLS